MAKRKRKRKSGGAKFSGCKKVRVRGKTRKMCWRNGRLVSNKAA